VGILRVNRDDCLKEIKDIIETRLDEWSRKRNLQFIFKQTDTTTFLIIMCGENTLPPKKDFDEIYTERVYKFASGKVVKYFVVWGKEVKSILDIAESYKSAVDEQNELSFRVWRENVSGKKGCYTINKVVDYIRINYSDVDLSIKTLADYVYLTPTYLSGLFKKNMGITIGQYIVDVRIANAKVYLKDPGLKFYQISVMVGYEDANYFAKIFKKKTGMTLTEYKESL
jgi:YesN/AraC family two-component response regulator